MSIFSLSEHLLQDYAKYVSSFLNIRDEQVRRFLDEELIGKGGLCGGVAPTNPAYEKWERCKTCAPSALWILSARDLL